MVSRVPQNGFVGLAKRFRAMRQDGLQDRPAFAKTAANRLGEKQE
jgi:hypothetical protein